jgi:hypothetical protein
MIPPLIRPSGMLCAILRASRFAGGHLHPPNPVREKSNFARPFRLIWAVQSRAQKYSSFAFSEFND